MARSSRYQRLCPVHRGFIAMSGSSDKVGGWPGAPSFSAGGPLITASGTVPRSSRPYRDERVLRSDHGRTMIMPCRTV